MIVDKSRLPIFKMLTIGMLPSLLKLFWYRLRGARISPGVKISLGSVISASHSVEIGADTTIGMFTSIDCKNLKIGKRTKIRSFVLIDAQEVIIGNDVIISETALIRTLVPSLRSKLVLHDRVHIFPFTIIDPSRKVEIGEESSVGYGTYIFTHSAYKSKLDGYPVEFGEVNIGKRVWLPCRVFISQSVNIGDEAVIGTGSLVTHDILAGALAVGSPAKAIKNQEEYALRYTTESKFEMLKDILKEFFQFLDDFASISWHQVETNDEKHHCVFDLRSIKCGISRIELFRNQLDISNARFSDGSICVVLGEIKVGVREEWEQQNIMWFSIDSHCCSEYLNDIGEELREFFRRYGLYFARP